MSKFAVFANIAIAVLACLFGYALFDTTPLETLQYMQPFFLGSAFTLIVDSLRKHDNPR